MDNFGEFADQCFSKHNDGKSSIVATSLASNVNDQSWRAEPFASLKRIIWSGSCDHIICSPYHQRNCINRKYCDVIFLIDMTFQCVSFQLVSLTRFSCELGINRARILARWLYPSITMTSQWPRWCLKSPAPRLFTEPFNQTQIKESINAPRHWPLCGEFTGSGEFHTQRASYAENVSIWWRHHALFNVNTLRSISIFLLWLRWGRYHKHKLSWCLEFSWMTT